MSLSIPGDRSYRLILHAGPMKTGSTYIQTIFTIAGPFLRANRVFFDAPLLEKVAAEGYWRSLMDRVSKEADIDVIVVSNEHLCCLPLAKIFPPDDRVVGRSSILTRRPLTELYPSLYLQRLKGGAREVLGYADYLDEQVLYDLNPGGSERATFNYAWLTRKLESEGYPVSSIEYSKKDLGSRTLRAIGIPASREWTGILEASEETMARAASGVSPLRSTALSLADIGRAINSASIEGRITNEDRDYLHAALLDVSAKLPISLRGSPSPREAGRAAAVDRILHVDPVGRARTVVLARSRRIARRLARSAHRELAAALKRLLR